MPALELLSWISAVISVLGEYLQTTVSARGTLSLVLFSSVISSLKTLSLYICYHLEKKSGDSHH